MTPAEAAGGRKLLDAFNDYPPAYGTESALVTWLWSHREELVRCAELAAEPRGAPSGHAMACGCARCVERRGRHEDWLGITPGGVPIVVDEPQGAPHAPGCKCRTCWGFEAKGTPQKPAFPPELDGSALEQPSDEGEEGQE